ncbi:hypothetical protein PIIN_07519 [Serendipita indica DSM 11827]|uniref:F-box domain-containing protein n=1 Tax=Serendipita indica (strain DSM 11827) TaxID=1109443 RepID=G4TQH4_SERID|nr:hypothetical protein PIIN_07519 [Serendipita indica DSM 11827]
MAKLEPFSAARKDLSLTCRYFRHILYLPRNRLTIISCTGGIVVPTWKTCAGWLPWEAERLEFYADRPLYYPIDGQSHGIAWPFSWLTESWDSLTSMVLPHNAPFDPTKILSRAPNLRLLSCRLWEVRRESGKTYPLLDHPQLRRLTHLSLSLDNGQLNMPLPKVTLESLKVLHLDFQGIPSDSVRTTIQSEFIPWTFPTLRTLSLDGRIKVGMYNDIKPFFERHKSVVLNLFNNLYSSTRTKILFSVLYHFDRLEWYGVRAISTLDEYNIFSCLERDLAQQGPSTLLLIGLCEPWVMFKRPSRFSAASAHMAGSPHRIMRVMLDLPWPAIDQALNALRGNSKRKIMTFLVGLQGLGFTIVDRLGVEAPPGLIQLHA